MNDDLKKSFPSRVKLFSCLIKLFCDLTIIVTSAVTIAAFFKYENTERFEMNFWVFAIVFGLYSIASILYHCHKISTDENYRKELRNRKKSWVIFWLLRSFFLSASTTFFASLIFEIFTAHFGLSKTPQYYFSMLGLVVTCFVAVKISLFSKKSFW